MNKATLLKNIANASDELDILYATIDSAKEATTNGFLEDVYDRILEMLDKEQSVLADLIAKTRQSLANERE